MRKPSKVTLTGDKPTKPTRENKQRPQARISQMPDMVAFLEARKELEELEAKSWRNVQLLNPDMLKEGLDPKDYPLIDDPITKQKVHAKYVKVKWLEGYRSKVGEKTVEGVRSIDVKPGKLLETYEGAMKKSKASKRFKENWADTFAFGGNNTGQMPLGEQLPYPPGPFTHQLYLQAMWDMQARVFQIRNHYGIAKGIISAITGFVVGEGVKLDAKDEKAQEVWDEFVKRVKLNERLPNHSDMLSGEGNLFWRVEGVRVDGKNGYSSLKTLSAGTIWEKITDPTNIFDVKGYWMQYPTQYQIFSVKDVPLAEYVLEVVPPDEVIHTTINVYEDEKFGRSDLLASLGDLKLIQDIQKYRGIRVINEAALVFDQTILGEDADVTNISNVQQSFLGPATVHTHNESVKFEIMQASATAQTKSGFHDEMLSQIGTGSGNMPADYIGGGQGTNRANALTKVEPAYKFFKRRQKTLEYALKQLFQKVIENAKKGGRLGKDLEVECEVIFPELAPENKTEKMAAIVLMETQGYWSHEKAAVTAAKEMEDTSYDYRETQKQINERKKQDAQLGMLYGPKFGAGYKPPMAQGTPGAGTPGAPGQDDKGGSKAPAQYGGDQEGLSNKSKKDVKDDLKKKEAISVTSLPALMKKGVAMKMNEDVCMAEQEMMKASGYSTDIEVAPPGWEPAVRAMKGHSSIDNPFALSWWMHGQGYKPK